MAKEQVAVGGVQAGHQQVEGEDQFFGVERGSRVGFGFGMELAEGVDEGVEVVGCDGLQGWQSWASFSFHGVDFTCSSTEFSNSLLAPLTKSPK